MCASQITEKYNDWIVGKIFIGVEDLYYPEGRTEIIETLKPMITRNHQSIRAIRQSEQTVDVYANFILHSNHKNAIRKTVDDRRICVMFCAQQHVQDLERDGLDKNYFERLYGWLDGGGYAAVTEFLRSYKIPEEFDLSCLLSRAPELSNQKLAFESIDDAVENAARYLPVDWIINVQIERDGYNVTLEQPNSDETVSIDGGHGIQSNINEAICVANEYAEKLCQLY